MTDNLGAWIAQSLDHTPRDAALFRRALTHGSHGEANYERLEFLGDRVLGLVASAWLYRRYPNEPEGNLSMRFNAIVSGEACAEIGRDIGVPAMMILGKQARDDGAQGSDNVVGDVVEALIGALYLDGGIDVAERFIHRAWEQKVETLTRAPKHPKSALQEWAAAHRCKPPVYTTESRSGPHHAPSFTVTVTVAGRGGGSAKAEGTSKQEAETAAAITLLGQLT
ncbi:ribonuclease III [Sphingomonas sp. BIUV-7]|uniref:Ribonuclease 3 n=1 Tax=Sphingomonas natans TaxID=3063330 RepID=A0ABT8Y3X8_9SPHN|nr:ribonuclease III [Sphingomonas sp. BIUV-7]MDO6413026.1 ribonuclease III [Sphingomonas sp. BIUV-7]